MTRAAGLGSRARRLRPPAPWKTPVVPSGGRPVASPASPAPPATATPSASRPGDDQPATGAVVAPGTLTLADRPPRRSRWRLGHLASVAQEELDNLDPAFLAGRVLSAPLPVGVASRLRTAIVRWCGLRVGLRSTIVGRLAITGGGRASRRVRIGSDCFINLGCHLDATAPIEIGDRVALGQHVLMTTSSHDMGRSDQRSGTLEHRAIRVGDGAWIAARAVVLPGVEIGEGAVVCAGAVVTRSVAPHTMVGGVPARVIKSLPVHSSP